jgi:UDP-N-acetyl-alpha-D-muramoyl-L-alanyl-L-glutamate epimerase
VAIAHVGHKSRQTEFVYAPPIVEGANLNLRYFAKTSEGMHYEFTERIEFPGSLEDVPPAPRNAVLRLLSLAASLSYFKAVAPAPVTVPQGLTELERRFLTALVGNGLGEFAYVNDIPEVLNTQVIAPHLSDSGLPAFPNTTGTQRALVAVGGGKDSIVSIEALRSAGKDIELFSVNTFLPIERTAQVARIPLNTVKRVLDPALLRLNSEGAPNGHIPVTAINSLLAVLTAMILRFDTVVFSNEASSSFGNVLWHGKTINHQWSKSIEFEKVLRDCLPPGAPIYVSLLRPITELRIARRFAKLTEYHSAFTSCNRAFKLSESDRTSWCNDCPKCRFVFLMLAPFLPRDALLEIFSGWDLLADSTQTKGFLELLGANGLLKPFECVGEPDECRVALDLLRSRSDWAGHRFFEVPEVTRFSATALEKEAVFAFNDDCHLLEADLESVARAV